VDPEVVVEAYIKPHCSGVRRRDIRIIILTEDNKQQQQQQLVLLLQIV
jgi:hypothetical protein